MEAPAGAQLLMVSGQIGMGPENLLKVNLYFVRAEVLGARRGSR